MYISCICGKENLRFDFLNHTRSDPPICLTKKVLRLTVILSDFVNYFVLLVHAERIPLSREQVRSSLQGHGRRARAARKRILECQIVFRQLHEPKPSRSRAGAELD
jgi:hypothetical protein